MQITCPKCKFTRYVADDQIPERSRIATCPECKARFQFREIEDLPQAEPDAATTVSEHSETTDSSPEQPPYYGPDGRGLDQPNLEADPQPEAAQNESDSPGLSAAERYLASKQNQDSTAESTTNVPNAPIQVDVPFEDLENFGFFSGMYQTIKRACLSPKLFFSIMPLRGLLRPLVFGLLIIEFVFIVTTFWQLSGLPTLTSLMLEARNIQPLSPEEALNPVLLFIFVPLTYLFNFILNTVIAHAVLTLAGGAKRGFEGTFRVMAYSYAPLILGIIPFGIVPAALWSLAISVIGLKNMHSTDYARAILAHVVIFVVLSLLYFVPMVPVPPAA